MTRTGPLVTDAARLGPTGLPLLDPADVHGGYPFGLRPDVPADPDPPDDPVVTLRAALRVALARPPCLVAFSGGRDSSVLLALAADTAARDGLPAPVAITLRYPDDPAAAESDWPEQVIAHLRRRGLEPERVCHDVGAELDLVGPLAAPVLRGHGAPVFPAAIAPTVLLTGYAAGGTLVTGNFGDEVFGDHRAAVLRAVWRRRGRRMTGSDRYLAAMAAAPRPVRARMLRSLVPTYPWLRAPLRDRMVDAQVTATLARPLRWDASVRSALRPRAVALGAAARDAVAARSDCVLVEPFGDPRFVAALARHGGRWGRLGRADAVRLLAGDLVPAALAGRRQKASFTRSRFGPVTRAFAAAWDGRGVDPDLVDVAALRAEWLSDAPSALTALLLQQAWLATDGGSG